MPCSICAKSVLRGFIATILEASTPRSSIEQQAHRTPCKRLLHTSFRPSCRPSSQTSTPNSDIPSNSHPSFSPGNGASASSSLAYTHYKPVVNLNINPGAVGRKTTTLATNGVGRFSKIRHASPSSQLEIPPGHPLDISKNSNARIRKKLEGFHEGRRPGQTSLSNTKFKSGGGRVISGTGSREQIAGPAVKASQREQWQIQKKALKEKFGDDGWNPRKRLSPDALEGIRVLHAQYPQEYPTAVLADHFKVSPEAIRRILKSKWKPSEEEEESRRQRWGKRGELIWSQMAQDGIKPPKKWRELGIGSSLKPKRRKREAILKGPSPSIQAVSLQAVAAPKNEHLKPTKRILAGSTL